MNGINLAVWTLQKRFSHVGRRSIAIESAINVEIFGPTAPKQCRFGQTSISKTVRMSGPLGSLDFPIYHGLEVKIESGAIVGERTLKVSLDERVFRSLSKYCRKFVHSMWGTTTTILRNNAEGVSEGFHIPLRLVGVGYRGSIDGNVLNLKLGYSHDILVPIPKDIKVTLPIPSKIILFGKDYQRITQLAAKIRSYRKPEPYNGKGIFVGNETIKLKEVSNLGTWYSFTLVIATKLPTSIATGLNLAFNFTITAIAGRLIFGESLSSRWYAGAFIIIMGTILIGTDGWIARKRIKRNI